MTESFDAEDLRILDELRELYTALEPVPPGLVRCAQFAVDVAGPGFDVALIESSGRLTAGVRGDSGTQITFDRPDGPAIMVQLQVHDDGHVRIDGWLAPPDGQHVELRTATGTIAVEVSPPGRFVIDRVPPGLVQFVVRTGGTTVVTPAIVL